MYGNDKHILSDGRCCAARGAYWVGTAGYSLEHDGLFYRQEKMDLPGRMLQHIPAAADELHTLKTDLTLSS